MKSLDASVVRQILRLRLEAGEGIRAIQREISWASAASVSRVAAAAAQAKLTWRSVQEMGDAELSAALRRGKAGCYFEPDFLEISEWLASDKRLTEDQAFEELYYRRAPAGALTYSRQRLYALYRQWLAENMGIESSASIPCSPGDCLEIDMVGDRPVWIDFQGRRTRLKVFAAALRFSGEIYAEAFMDEKLRSWQLGTAHALEALGVPRTLSMDNARALVSRPHPFMAVVSAAMEQLCRHFGLAPLACHVRRPSEKSAVERSCGLLERELARMSGTLGGICAGSLGEFNQALARAVGEINRRPFEKKAGGCRQSLYEQCEKPVLRPCPAVPFEACEWRICHADKHHMATVDGKRYMVHYLLAGKEVRACVGSARITFYNPADNSAAGSYARDYAEGYARHEDECLMSPAELAFRRGPGECRQWFCSHGLGLPRILALVDAIYSKDGAAMIRYRRISSLKGMYAKFGAEAVDKACMNAAAGGRPLTAAVLRGLLEHGCKPGAAKSAARGKPPRGAAASEAFLQSDWTLRGGSHD